jgi:hypothetical protein
MYVRDGGSQQPQVKRFVNELGTWAGLHVLGGYVSSILTAAVGGLLLVFDPDHALG